MYRNQLKFGIAFLWSVFLLSPACKREEIRTPLENDGVPPGVVSNVQVENLNGAAKISYAIPGDEDLIYVLAKYEIDKGQEEEMTASYYNNSMLLEGFRDTIEYPVELYAVDRGGNISEPVKVMVKPLISPVMIAYNSLAYVADFGGISISTYNEAKANIVISVAVKDENGFWVDYDKFYTNQQQIGFSVRGLPAAPTTFGVSMKDRWGHYSDTLVRELSPLFEKELDVSKFREMHLPTDMENVIWAFTDLWNANTPANIGGFHSPDNGGFPGWLTMDLGVEAKLSRIKMWGLTDGREYTGGHVQRFEIWGSVAPDPDGSFDGWVLLQDCTVKKPSGLPSGQLSNEDMEYARSGFEFGIPIDAPEVRYIRIKVLSSFSQPENSKSGSFWIKRLAYWGDTEL